MVDPSESPEHAGTHIVVDAQDAGQFPKLGGHQNRPHNIIVLIIGTPKLVPFINPKPCIVAIEEPRWAHAFPT